MTAECDGQCADRDATHTTAWIYGRVDTSRSCQPSREDWSTVIHPKGLT